MAKNSGSTKTKNITPKVVTTGPTNPDPIELEAKPYTVKIGYMTYPVIEKDYIYFNGNLVRGLHEQDTQTITISSLLPPQQKARVAIHEVLHGICDMYDIDLSEEKHDLLAIGVSQFLKDNPEYVEALIQDLIDPV